MKKLIILVLILIGVLFAVSLLAKYFPDLDSKLTTTPERVKVVSEESITIDVVKKVGPSVVTIVEDQPQRTLRFGPFIDESDPDPKNIGSGFIVSRDGLIVTNKHVVSDLNAKYQIITSLDRTYDVENIYRDPLNDIAILKVSPSDYPGGKFEEVELGDSGKLTVGQFAIAIGTALGEFRNTVTTGVVSGLGRGVTAGSEFEGFVERLDNVIQTSAAINPGNSGGPLVNSSGQVIGVNTAIASSGQNIGFALPINIVKEALENFKENGEIRRPYLGVVYTTVTADLSESENLPQGAYIREVVEGSGAEKAGIKIGDIIVSADGKKISESSNTDLGDIIAKKNIGDKIVLKIVRDGSQLDISAQISQAPNE